MTEEWDQKMTARELWEATKSEENMPLTDSMPVIKARTSMDGVLFTTARYKFVARMLEPRKKAAALELGCNNGFGTRYVRHRCDLSKLVGVDFDHEAIEVAKAEVADDVCEFLEGDFLLRDYKSLSPRGGYSCVYSMDVIEHIPQQDEQKFVDTIWQNLSEDGFAVVGTPNVTMYPYANPWNKLRHINNFDQQRLYDLLSTRFNQVFMFGMTDEVLHTGFYPMCCYIMALACQKKR